MESLEEERLVQMVHDFIESGISLGSLSSSSEINHLNRSTSILLQDVLENVTVSEMEIFTRVLNYLKKNRFDENNVIAKRHLMMELRMDGYDASLCKSSWDSSMNCAGGDYEYIDVLMVDEEGVTVRLIVDIDFKSQFELARPTVTYSELSNSLPSIFVGNEDKLRTVITLICSAAKDSLKREDYIFLLGEQPVTCNLSGFLVVRKNPTSVYQFLVKKLADMIKKVKLNIIVQRTTTGLLQK